MDFCKTAFHECSLNYITTSFDFQKQLNQYIFQNNELTQNPIILFSLVLKVDATKVPLNSVWAIILENILIKLCIIWALVIYNYVHSNIQYNFKTIAYTKSECTFISSVWKVVRVNVVSKSAFDNLMTFKRHYFEIQKEV